MVKIYWGFRLAFDLGLFAVFTNYFCIQPTYLWRYRKMEGVRWV